MKILKKILRLFVPLILNPAYLLGVYKKLIAGKNSIDYEKSFFKRHAFVNKALYKYKNPNYLEIGVANNDLFNSIPLKLSNKYGVDPISGGNFRMTSDDFFLKNLNLRFDVIFIDGLHHYKQVQKDLINSVNFLNENGIIMIHDMLPRNSFEEHVPRKNKIWTGDVWKVGVELTNSSNVDFRIVNIDCGIGIVKIYKNFKYKKMSELTNLRFDAFLKYYPKFKIISSEEALDFIQS